MQIPFKFGIDSSGNYGYIKDGADTVIPFKSQSDIDNAYNNGYTKGKADGKNEYSSIFVGSDKVGYTGIIVDNTYNVPWVIYTINGNTYQLFPMKNLGSHVMNSNGYNTGGYTASDMYTYIHNTILPNLIKGTGLNIASCDLVSQSVYNDICSKTGKELSVIAGGEDFWLTRSNSTYFIYVYGEKTIITSGYANGIHGVRPLITVVK